MWLMIILNATKKQGFTRSLENALLEKLQGIFLGLKTSQNLQEKTYVGISSQ